MGPFLFLIQFSRTISVLYGGFTYQTEWCLKRLGVQDTGCRPVDKSDVASLDPPWYGSRQALGCALVPKLRQCHRVPDRQCGGLYSLLFELFVWRRQLPKLLTALQLLSTLQKKEITFN